MAVRHWMGRIIKAPYTYARKMIQSIESTMDGMAQIFEAIGDIGTIPEEFETEYERTYSINKPLETCDDEMICDWGGAIGPYSTMCCSDRLRGSDIVSCVECPITQDLFSAETMVAVTRCGHMFELGALKRWFSVSTTCPSCRHDMVIW